MYSSEIKQFLEERNYVVSIDEYVMLTDPDLHPQIDMVKCDIWDGKIKMLMKDEFYFEFKIKGD